MSQDIGDIASVRRTRTSSIRPAVARQLQSRQLDRAGFRGGHTRLTNAGVQVRRPEMSAAKSARGRTGERAGRTGGVAAHNALLIRR